VKADPDAVFLPDRLRLHLKLVSLGWGEKKYLRNCKLFGSMQGPLEVLSTASVVALSTDVWRCKQSIDRSKVGEDGFMQKCMDLLGAEAVYDFEFLTDKYCNQQPRPCTDGWSAGFHPFKSSESYLQCLRDIGIP